MIIEGRIQCCNAKVDKEPTANRRMSDVALGRNRPSRIGQKRILKEQGHRCIYCERHFGATMWRGRKKLKLRVTWDHFIPYTYSLNNRLANFVAACQICNSLKGALMFQTLDEARVHVKTKAEAKGFTDVRPVLGEFHPQKTLAKVL